MPMVFVFKKERVSQTSKFFYSLIWEKKKSTILKIPAMGRDGKKRVRIVAL
tara:strand:- start:1609 stop:1761 length:153 start_codon:yes stop_codon:yes gene_type:complete